MVTADCIMIAEWNVGGCGANIYKIIRTHTHSHLGASVKLSPVHKLCNVMETVTFDHTPKFTSVSQKSENMPLCGRLIMTRCFRLASYLPHITLETCQKQQMVHETMTILCLQLKTDIVRTA